MLEIACSTITFGMLPLPDALDAIADLGFTTTEVGAVGPFCPHVDLDADPAEEGRRLAALLADRGLQVTSINAVPFLYVTDREDVEQHAAVIDRVLDLSATLGCGLILNAGLRQADNDKALTASADLLRAAVRRGRDLGVRVTVEAPHAGMTTASVEEAALLLELVGEPDLQLTYDASHIVVGGSDSCASLALVGDRIGSVQARDARGQDFHLTPGDGDVDWDTLLAHLVAGDFAEPIVIELEYGGALGVADIRVETERARDFLQQRLAELTAQAR